MVQHYLGDDSGAFDPDEIRLMNSALAEAWQRILAAGAKFNGHEQEARESLARSIIELARSGEKSQQSLIDGALLRFRR
jgi:hypothetical protein